MNEIETINIVKKFDWGDCNVYRLQKGNRQTDWIDKDNNLSKVKSEEEKQELLETVWDAMDDCEIFEALDENKPADWDYFNRPIFG